MDLVGEIVEKDPGVPTVPEPPKSTELKKFSSFKHRKNAKSSSSSTPSSNPSIPLQSRPQSKPQSKPQRQTQTQPQPQPTNPDLTEAEKIHLENMQKISSMTDEDIDNERRELLEGLNPKLVQSLIQRAQKREQEEAHQHQHAEGYEGWIGGMKTSEGVVKELSHLDKDDINKALGINNNNTKLVRFDEAAPTTVEYQDLPEGTEINENGWEDVDDINELVPKRNNEIASDDYQILKQSDEELHQDGVHFPKPTSSQSSSQSQSQDLDINDPEFYDKLHEKYYPDLPKETSKLAWMTEPLPVQTTNTYESISDMRFDFHGNLLELNQNQDSNSTNDIPTYLGLHHHSDNPHLPGYTLTELVHLSRSMVPGQRCLSIQVLGRVLHKLGLHKYNILPVVEDDDNDNKEFNDNVKQMMIEFEKLMWKLIDELRVIDSITEAADESKTKNLSIRSYAVEALWLWKQGGGNPYENSPQDDQELNNDY